MIISEQSFRSFSIERASKRMSQRRRWDSSRANILSKSGIKVTSVAANLTVRCWRQGDLKAAAEIGRLGEEQLGPPCSGCLTRRPVCEAAVEHGDPSLLPKQSQTNSSNSCSFFFLQTLLSSRFHAWRRL